MQLNRGDKVDIIAPASQLRGPDRDLLPGAVSLLESWGLRVRARVGEGHHFYLAGPDAVRAAHLNAALSDPDTRAVFCLRGGYGSPRLLPYLDTEMRPPRKLLVGYSDVTALHAAIGRIWPQIELIHGPNVATRQLLGEGPRCEMTRRSLFDALFSADRDVVARVEFLRPGRTRGLLVGGCLSMLVSVLGTRYALNTRGRILFLEDTGEAPYRIDRMVTQLRNAGKFKGVRGLVFGEMHNCKDPYNDLRTVICDLFQDAPFPVAFGLRSGHGEVSLSLRLGAATELNDETGVFRQFGDPCGRRACAPARPSGKPRPGR